MSSLHQSFIPHLNGYLCLAEFHTSHSFESLFFVFSFDFLPQLDFIPVHSGIKIRVCGHAMQCIIRPTLTPWIRYEGEIVPLHTEPQGHFKEKFENLKSLTYFIKKILGRQLGNANLSYKHFIGLKRDFTLTYSWQDWWSCKMHITFSSQSLL